MSTSWDGLIEELRSRPSVAAERSAELLEIARHWASRVEVTTSHNDLVFTRAGEKWPSADTVRVAWKDTFYEFRYGGAVGVGGLTAADRCRPENARAVLDSFLYQLAE